MAKKRHRYNEPSTDGDDENLILGQEGQQDEQMKFRDNDNSRPNPEVERDLETRDTPFDKVDFPDEHGEFRNYEELLASDEYTHALEKISQITGIESLNLGTGESQRFASLSNVGLKAFQEVLQTEISHEEQLEELCTRIIKDYFKIPEDALQYNFKLIRETLKLQNTPSKQELKQREEELTEDINDLTLERAKRRLVNAMTQGQSVNDQYVYEELADQLAEITGDENIVPKYSIVLALNVLGYWHWGQDKIDMGMGADGGEGDMGAGEAKIDTTTNPPTVNAKGLIFPVLVHEAMKSVMEYLGKERNPEDEDKYNKAVELEDQIQHEIWDIRLGPAIWRKLIGLFPRSVIEDDDKKKLQFYMYSNIVNLPAKEFLVLMKEILGGTEDGKSLLSAMYYDLTMVIDDEEVTNEDSHFKNKMAEVMGNHQNDNFDDLDDLLGSLGITISNN